MNAIAADVRTPLAILGGLVLWLLRLALAPSSTLAGFRAWVLEECPVAPGRRTASGEGDQDRPVPGSSHRTAWVSASIPLNRVAALARYDLRAVAAWVSGADPDVQLHATESIG